MSQLTVLLVHPNSEIRQHLRSMIEEVPFLRVLGECVTPREALDLLDAIAYGVLFVGVELNNEMSGLELARMLMSRTRRPALVFLAADEQHAFTAFELDATDYLIFPCPKERFVRTTERLLQYKSTCNLAPEPSSRWKERHHPPVESASPHSMLSQSGEEEQEKTLQLPLGEEEQELFLAALKQAWEYTNTFRPVEIERLAISLDGKTTLLPYSEIIFVEAYEDYTYVHTATEKYLTSYRMKILEGRLKAHRFFRVHRKYLVNLDMVTEIATVPGANCMLRTAGRTRIELPISRRRLTELKHVLGL